MLTRRIFPPKSQRETRNHTWESYSGGLPISKKPTRWDLADTLNNSRVSSGDTGASENLVQSLSQEGLDTIKWFWNVFCTHQEIAPSRRVNLSIRQLQQVKRWPRKCKFATTSEFRNFGLSRFDPVAGAGDLELEKHTTHYSKPHTKSSKTNLCIFGTHKNLQSKHSAYLAHTKSSQGTFSIFSTPKKQRFSIFGTQQIFKANIQHIWHTTNL